MLCIMSVGDTTWLIMPNHPVQHWTTKSKIHIFLSFSCPSMILSKEVLKLLLSTAEVNFVCVSFHKLRLKFKVKISVQHKIQESKFFYTTEHRDIECGFCMGPSRHCCCDITAVT